MRTFSIYPSFAMARMVKDLRRKEKGKARGYGFVSFLDAVDASKAIREMDGKFISHRPITVKKSTWNDRQDVTVHKKSKSKDGSWQNLSRMNKRQKNRHITGLLGVEGGGLVLPDLA